MKRKCFVKGFIPREYEYFNNNGRLITEEAWKEIEGGKKEIKVGTGILETDFNTPAIFECWGVDSDGGASYTVAIVRFDDGTCGMINVTNIKFTD